jgi:hypothetical protein
MRALPPSVFGCDLRGRQTAPFDQGVNVVAFVVTPKVQTLVYTRGPNFPLSRLESRLMCPSCGNRRVTVVFEPPSNSQIIG